MATMNISLPQAMRDWVNQQIDAGQYANNSDYIRDLIRHDQRRREKLDRMQRAITSGIESGEPQSLDISAIKARARAKSET